MSKVLVVEDDNNLREIYETSLKAEGYDTASADDGMEAIEVAGRDKPDLIISDVMMPRLSGFEMLEKMRQDQNLKDVPVIMMTALSMAEDKETAKRLGVVHYLVKSQVTLEDFVNVAKKFVAPDAVSGSATASQASDDSATPATTDDNQTVEPSEKEEPAPEQEHAPTPEPTPTPEPPPEPAPAPIPEPDPEPEPAKPTEFTSAATTEPTTTEPTTPPVSHSQSTDEETDVVEEQIQDFVDNHQAVDSPDVKTAPAENLDALTANPIASSTPSDSSANSGKKVIEPIADPNKKDIHELAEADEAQQTASQPVKNPSAGSTVDPDSIAL
jgi:CheY-like chemotaxis protein